MADVSIMRAIQDCSGRFLEPHFRPRTVASKLALSGLLTGPPRGPNWGVVHRARPDFLRHKIGNMARWVSDEVGKENLPVDVVELVNGSRGVEPVYFAELLAEHRVTVTHRDWRKLLALIDREGARLGHDARDGGPRPSTWEPKSTASLGGYASD